MYRQVPEVVLNLVLICRSIFIFRQNLARSELNLVTCKYIGFGLLSAVFYFKIVAPKNAVLKYRPPIF